MIFIKQIGLNEIIEVELVTDTESGVHSFINVEAPAVEAFATALNYWVSNKDNLPARDELKFYIYSE